MPSATSLYQEWITGTGSPFLIFAQAVAGAACQILLLWVFFSWISRRFISCPLTHLTQSVEAFDLEKPENPAETVLIQGEDELAILSRAFSAMQKRLMGDVMQIKSIAEELKSESDAMAPLCDELVRLAEDFDFDGIQKFVLELDS